MWTSLELADPQNATLSAPADQGQYNVGLQDHVTAISDEEPLMASVLIHTYALSEWAAADQLGVDSRTFNGIEDWGYQLISKIGNDWNGVDGGLAGAVEVAVVRNAFAHGTRTIDANDEARLQNVGLASRAAGDPVTLTYPELREYRRRLLSLLRHGGLG